jgi:hypothetical protein
MALSIVFAYAAEPQLGTEADRQTILQLERDWSHSVVTQDVPANERIMAPDYRGVNSQGSLVTKQAVISALRVDDPLESNKLNEDDVFIRFFDTFAIANGSENWKAKDGSTGRNVWTDVLVKRDGKWQVIASQDSEFPDKKDTAEACPDNKKAPAKPDEKTDEKKDQTGTK